EVGDLRVAYEVRNAVSVGDDGGFVILLEGHALLGELRDDRLDVVDVEAGDRERRRARVRRQVHVDLLVTCTRVSDVVAGVGARHEAEYAFVVSARPSHVGNGSGRAA